MLQAYSNDIIVLHNLPNIKIFLELNYCILLVQGRYSSVLHLKVFAPTADSDATTCSVSIRLSNTSLSLSRYSYIPYVYFSWLLLRCALTANLTVHLPRGLVTYLSTLAYTPNIHVKFQINGRIRYLLLVRILLLLSIFQTLYHLGNCF